jgi:DNA-directed RNA polymerase subunit RPC12/RpoP
MSERKVLNKYIPPNFDPEKIPKGLGGPKPKQHTVRLMAPFSMRCNTCGEFIYKGRKFNARKETVDEETYLSIKIFRFYVRCPQCGSEITFKTDPKNADYVAELGAKRNFEPWREEAKESEAMKIKRALEEEHNPLKALENKAIDSKREIDIAEGLDEIRTVNARLELVDTDAVLDEIHRKREVELERQHISASIGGEEEEALIQQVFKTNESKIKRVSEEDEQVKLLSSAIGRPSVSKPSLPTSRKSLGIVPKKI